MNRIPIILFSILMAGCSENSDKPLILGKHITVEKGLVVSAHAEASRAGAEILKKGGNAIDAAVATEFALAVCYPEAGNIGGGGFMVVRLADGSAGVIDYREKAPAQASKDMYLDADGNVIAGLSSETHLASGVPGTVDGMVSAHARYGSLPFAELIQPAVDLAEKGFPINSEQASNLNNNRDMFLQRNRIIPAFVKDHDWKEGDTLVQKDLARTLVRIRDKGRDGFYSGETAEMIVKEMKRGNGIISLNDLAGYKAVTRIPLTCNYKGYRIITLPPPSGGGVILLQLLKMTEPYPLGEWGFLSPKTIHLITEAERRVFADRSLHLGDPDYMKVSVDQLTDNTYLATRMSSFSETRASSSAEIQAGSPPGYIPEETTHYSVADAYGNAVAATTTLNGTYGSGIVVEGAGFLLNNQMDDFAIKPGFPNMYGLIGGEVNSVRPGKKILSSMTPVIVEKDGKLFLVAGSPGGSTIPTTVYQVITNIIDHGMNLSQAVDTARFHHQWLPDRISYEKGRIDSATLVILNNLGHETSPRSSIGRVNTIMMLENGRKAGVADRRGDNCAAGY